MNVLVDTSVWIDYFRGSEKASRLDFLIEENLIVINELILTELVPFLRLKRQRKLISLLQTIEKSDLKIEWNGIVELQVKCLRSGVNKVGIPDLIIAQNAIQNEMPVYSLDKHFSLIGNCTSLKILGIQK